MDPAGKVENFSAEDGELKLFSKVNVWVISDLQLADFEVEAEVKIPTDYKVFNSGLGFRLVGDKGKPKGYQFEIDRDKPGGVYGIGMGGWLYPNKSTAAGTKNDLTTYLILWTGTMYVSSVRDRTSPLISMAS